MNFQKKRPPGRNGYRYKPQFGLIVPCRDEADQQLVFGKLSALGYKPKVVCV